MIKRIISITILLGFSIYVSLLLQTGKITFYINPRYILLTQIFTVIAVFVAVAALVRQYELRKAHIHSHGWERGEILGTVVLSIILIIGLALPVRSLSIATAAQRDVDFNSFNFDLDSSAPAFFESSENLGLGDWVVSLNYDPDPAKYLGKEVNVTGFAYFSQQGSDGTFNLSRFVVTCCAVDARPIGLPVLIEEYEITENNWYQLTGEFVLDANNQLVVKADEINQIEEPDDPYVF